MALNDVIDPAVFNPEEGVHEAHENQIAEERKVAELVVAANRTVTEQTAAYTLTVADSDSTVLVNAGAAVALTLPADATADLAVGTRVKVVQAGAGAVTLTADTGVTINQAEGGLVTQGAGAVAEVIKTAANTYVAFGNLGI